MHHWHFISQPQQTYSALVSFTAGHCKSDSLCTLSVSFTFDQKHICCCVLVVWATLGLLQFKSIVACLICITFKSDSMFTGWHAEQFKHFGQLDVANVVIVATWTTCIQTELKSVWHVLSEISPVALFIKFLWTLAWNTCSSSHLISVFSVCSLQHGLCFINKALGHCL